MHDRPGTTPGVGKRRAFPRGLNRIESGTAVLLSTSIFSTGLLFTLVLTDCVEQEVEVRLSLAPQK